MREADGGEEEVADLDGEAHDPTDPQAHHLTGEEEEEDRVAAARERPAPPRRRSTPGRRRGNPGNTKTAPTAELTSSTVTLLERRRLRGGRRRGISRPWISPREKRARKFHRSHASPRELRLGLAAKERNPRVFRQSQGRAGEMAGRGLAPHPGAAIKHAKMAQLGLAGRSEPISNTPLSSVC
jgi:hypothetical protein